MGRGRLRHPRAAVHGLGGNLDHGSVAAGHAAAARLHLRGPRLGPRWIAADSEEARMTSWKRLAAAGLMAVAVPAAMLWVSVRACGPDFEPEVFVPGHQPEQPKLY